MLIRARPLPETSRLASWQVGHPVTRLVRTQIGPIRLGDLRSGTTRVLSQPEVGSLMALVGM